MVGRSAYCAIVVSNNAASREHCVLRLTEEGLTVTDMGSRNGTFVNGARIEGRTLLLAGDVVRIGGDVIEILEGEDPKERARLQTNPFEHEEATTNGHGGTIDLLESMLAAGKDALPLDTAAGAIELLFERLKEQAKSKPRPLSASTKSRLMDAATRFAAWFPDGSRDAWLARLAQDLEKAMTK